MIKGETVILYRPIKETDDFGEVIETYDEGTELEDVLVAPASTDDLEVGRQMGVEIALELHMPKSFTDDLYRCRFRVRGEERLYQVVGRPTYYTDSNTPTKWHYPVSVERVDG